MSRNFLLLAIAIMLATHFLYYPKWEKGGTEATLSWDVSGYYMYLPAAFIYKDLRKLDFKEDVLQKYQPTPELQQAFLHENSGNYVMKYSIGQAVILSPGFFIGHLWASFSSTYPADGFSFPYQFMISMWVLFITILGLIFLRKVLLTYFDEIPTGLTLLGLVLGSNYLNYAAIDGAMTHNTLFTVYTFLIYFTIRFYKNPSVLSSIGVGLMVGLATLTRPTEIISVIIPVLWGIHLWKIDEVGKRLIFFKNHLLYLGIAVVVCGMIGSLQFIYWKYASGEWIVYSYEEQGFSWLRPHLLDGIFSYKSGWLTYSPFMIFSLIGFHQLFRKRKEIFSATLIFAVLFIYIAFAWDIWWYGGSLGQRAMVQSYPVLSIPLCAFFAGLLNMKKWFKIPIYLLMIVFVYANLWFTHQAHLGGLIHVGQMRKAYFWKTLFTYDKNPENLKLLDDVNVVYGGPTSNVQLIFQDTSMIATLDQNNQFSPEIKISTAEIESNFDWIRVSAECSITQKEWFFWTMTQFIVEVYNGTEKVSGHMIRIQRHMNDNQSKRVYLDLQRPDEPYDSLIVKFWNADGNKSIRIEHLKVETFNER